MAPWTIPPSTLLLAGGRPAAIAPSATPLQWTTEFWARAAGVAVNAKVSAATSMSTAPATVPIFDLLNVFSDFMVLPSLFLFWFSLATSAWFVVSPDQGVFRELITPRVLKYFLGGSRGWTERCEIGPEINRSASVLNSASTS
jgi:hypothetical protein